MVAWYKFTFAVWHKLGSLSRDVFERPTSTGSELFSLLVCLDANKFVLLSFFSPLKTIYSRVSTKPLPNDAKSPLPVDVRRSKTLLLKLPIGTTGTATKNGKKTIGLISKTKTLHVHHTFLYISFPFLHDYDVKMSKFAFYGERKQAKSQKYRRMYGSLTMFQES